MRSTLFINSKPPYSTQATKEALDAALASAAFGVNVGLLFMGDGVFQIAQHQAPNPANLKKTAPIFQSLELYEITNLYVSADALSERGLTEQELIVPATLVNGSGVRALLNQFDNLLSY